jgi:hypothetical protein
MSSYYPETEKGDQTKPYYVEFERGDKKGEFTLFKRQWFQTTEALAKQAAESKKSAWMLELCNECHPWNIYTATYGPDGCMPDRAWVCWMVDALNRQSQVENLDESILKTLERKKASQ